MFFSLLRPKKVLGLSAHTVAVVESHIPGLRVRFLRVHPVVSAGAGLQEIPVVDRMHLSKQQSFAI